MNQRGTKDFLLNAMPPGEWCSVDWAYSVLRAKYGGRFTVPFALFRKLMAEGKVERRMAPRSQDKHVVSEYRRIADAQNS